MPIARTRPPLVLPRTDDAPLRGLHPSLATCGGLPPDFTHNAMLGTNDWIIRRTVRFGGSSGIFVGPWGKPGVARAISSDARCGRRGLCSL